MPTILAFIAHPDDESYNFAGTLALAARSGWRCVVFSATHGERGERHDGQPLHPSSLADTREAELIASCHALRIDPPQFWGLPDGELHIHRGEEQRIARLIAAYEPDLLFTHGPDGAYGHPDHIAVHRWVSNTWASLGEPPPLLYPAFPPGLFVPQYEKCRASGIMGDPPILRRDRVGTPHHHYVIDITSRQAAKVAAIAAHASQLPGGDPNALFPPGIIGALLDVERFEDAAGQYNSATAMVLSRISA